MLFMLILKGFSKIVKKKKNVVVKNLYHVKGKYEQKTGNCRLWIRPIDIESFVKAYRLVILPFEYIFTKTFVSRHSISSILWTIEQATPSDHTLPLLKRTRMCYTFIHYYLGAILVLGKREQNQSWWEKLLPVLIWVRDKDTYTITTINELLIKPEYIVLKVRYIKKIIFKNAVYLY